MSQVPSLSIPLYSKEIVLTHQLLSNLFYIPMLEKNTFLPFHKRISNMGLDKLTLYRSISAMPWWWWRPRHLPSTDVILADLFVGHNILLKGDIKMSWNNSLIPFYIASEKTSSLTFLLIIQNIAHRFWRCENRPTYEMILARIFKYFKVPLDGQTSLNFTQLDELTCGRMADEMARHHTQSGHVD